MRARRLVRAAELCTKAHMFLLTRRRGRSLMDRSFDKSEVTGLIYCLVCCVWIMQVSQVNVKYCSFVSIKRNRFKSTVPGT